MTYLTRHHTPEPPYGVPVKEVRRQFDWIRFGGHVAILACALFTGWLFLSLIGG